MLLRLIEDIIDISKIESGQLNIEKSEFNVSEMMQEIYDYYKAEMIRNGKDENIEFVFQNLNQDLFVVNDYLRIKQVLSNLINNAIKFTTKGIVEFSVRIEGNDLLFSVVDTGIGIHEDENDLMFKRFSRVNKEQVKLHGGTGLGLAICKSIVDLLEGEIWFDSVYQKGSSFFVKIPFEKIVSDKPEIDQIDTSLSFSIEGSVILIAEDDEINFMFINELLSEYKVKVIRAMNGAEAVQIVANNPQVSIVLMDLQMPVMDGLQAIKQIRETNKKIPIIAQTAFAFASEKSASINAGCNDYITKPISQNELIEKLNYYISRK
ncbi:MAG: hypothetical protein CVU05_14380 [Bacteroidetes bacterium HGW-Bacteroidetes-21]|nr:MAG: hypothetical protein CVU05_14380 [Bacteroidetes bacterium HGW-Bacteroidetes-21]